MKTLYLAGGCFWGVQRFFDQFDGIKDTTVGYANGKKADPTYEEVCQSSGHAETVRVTYDEAILTTEKLLKYYLMVVDPISVNKQGNDIGIQYRTGIYYEDESVLPAIKAVLSEEQKKYSEPIAIEVKKLENFYLAEEYHQKYLVKNPGGYCHINTAMLKL